MFILDCGYSIADIAVFGYVHVLEEAGLPLNEYPAIADWISNVSNTPGFRPITELGLADRRAA